MANLTDADKVLRNDTGKDIVTVLSKMSTLTTKQITNTPIASFTDGADNIPLKACEIDIESIQDLHGYDKPWAGGAGKNKLPLVLADIKSANTSGTWSGNVYTIDSATFTVNTDNDGNVISIVGKGNGSSQNYISLPLTLKSGSYILTSDMSEEVGSYDTFLLSGGSTIARGNSSYPGQSFTLNSDSSVEWRFRVQNNSNYTCKPMIRLSTETSATFEPYSNICSISGFDNGVVSVCGKNLVDTSLCTNRTASGVTSTLNSNGSINLNGTASATARWWHSNDDMTILLKAGTYTTSTNISGVGLTLFTSEGYKSGTFTLTSDMLVTNLIFELEIGRNYNVDVLPQLEVGNQATTYEPYTSNNYTFTFGQTVYGGHFDNKGNLVVTHGEINFNGSENWVTNGDKGVFILTSSIPNIDTTKPILFEEYQTIATGQAPTNDGQSNYNSARTAIQIHDERGMTDTAYKTFLANHNIKMLYSLANPITLAITSQDIPTLLGENNIFSNCGDINSLVYYPQGQDAVVSLNSIANGVLGIADVLTEGLDNIAEAVVPRAATEIPIQSGSATNTKDYIDNKTNYSTTETAIGEWIDGRTVYQKVILINATISNSWVDADTISGITRIVGAEFIVYEGGARGSGVRQGLFAEISLIDTDVVKIYNNTSYNIQVDYLILRYTKS